MPIYEYQCSSCGHEESALERMNAPRSKKCPACGRRDSLQRLVSAAGFQLKGSGWYQTDFKDSGKPKPAAKSDGDKDGKSGKDEKDGKPAEGGEKEQKKGSADSRSGKAKDADKKSAGAKTPAP